MLRRHPVLALFPLLLAPLACEPPTADPDLALLRGRNALSSGRADWARAYFAEDLAQNPTRQEAKLGLARAWLLGQERSLSRVVEILEGLVSAEDPAARTDPDLREARLLLATAYLRYGEVDTGLAVLQDMEQELDAQLLKARLLALREPQHAMSALAQAEELGAAGAEIHVLKSDLAQRLGDNALALAEIDHALAVDPLQPRLHYRRSRLLLELGQAEEAARALNLRSKVQSLIQSGGDGNDTPGGQSAHQALQELRELEQYVDNTAPSFAARLVRRLLETGQGTEAEELAGALLADGRCSVNQLFALARQAQRHGRNELAQSLCEQVLQREAEHLPAHAFRAELSWRMGDTEQAKARLQQLLALAPWYAPAHHLAGQIALSTGAELEARHSLQRAVDLAPWIAHYYPSLVELLLSQGEPESVDQLLAMAPDEPAIAAYRRRLGR